MSERAAAVRALHRARPRSRFARLTGVALTALVVLAWTSGLFASDDLFSGRRRENVARFLEEIRPYPLQGRAWDWSVAASWAGDTLRGRWGDAIMATLALSVAAIVLAGLWALGATVLAARNVANAEPFLPGPRPPSAAARRGWRAVAWTTRGALVAVRAVPEYVWAFLLLAVFGKNAWPGVLALALHNTGILGKLFAEVVEDGDATVPRALRATGASRLQIATTALFPQHLNRLLLYFFYRWETCVREATVLGMLGFVSLGWFVDESRHARRFDEMLLFILLGAALILVGDLVSTLARTWLRRAR